MLYKRFKYLRLSSSRKIRFLSSKSTKKICVIFLHGFMSDIEGDKPAYFLKFCKKKQINFLTMEYSGHGKSYGEFLKGNISKWTIDAYKTINSKMRGKDLIIIGSSMGAWIGLNLILKFKNKIKGFIGISSAPEFLEKLMWNKFTKEIKKTINKKKIYYLKHGDYTYPLTKQLFLDGKKNKIFNKKINLKIPIQIFHSIKDDVVPVYFSKKILKIFPYAKKKLFIFKDGDHRLSRKKDLKRIGKSLNEIILNYSATLV